MTEFVELPNGRLISIAAIRDFNPPRSNRIDYIFGGYELLNDAEAEAVLAALKPKTVDPPPAVKPKRQPKRVTAKE